MATTVAQPGTALKKIAKQFASEAGMSTDDYLARLRRLNPDYSKEAGFARLGRGVGTQQNVGNGVMDKIRLGSPANFGEALGPGEGAPGEEMPEQFDPNQVMNILDSPLYSQNLRDYYLSQYLPGLTQATFNINQAQTEFGSNEADRARQRGEAIRRVAGGYAARGMRSPGAINRDRSEIQSEFGKLSRAEQARIQALQNERDVMFGAGTTDAETFLSDPVKFGSIGAGARRSSLEGLQQLPDQYGLLGLGASRAPLAQQPAAAGSASAPKATKTPKVKTPKVKTPPPVIRPPVYTPPAPQTFSRAQITASEARRDAAMAARAPGRR
jgi:hypothetical protein